MLQEIRELKKELDLKRKGEYKKDKDGRVIVDLTVRNDDQFLSPYSTAENSVISSEISEFIECSLKAVPTSERIAFKVYSNSITEAESKEYTKAVHTYYAESYQNVRAEKRKLQFIAFCMAMVAVVVLGIMFTLEALGRTGEVFLEVIDIFAWVFMWEAVDVFFLQCTLLRNKERRYLHLVDSTFEYLPLS